MNFLSRLIFGVLLVFFTGCSQSEDRQAEKPVESSPLVPQKQDLSPPDLSDQKASAIPEPIHLSEADQKIADQAPEGMVFIKGGCFFMGNDNAQVDEQPEHEVCVKDFYLDKYEVIQSRWEKIMEYNPAKFVGPDSPVEQVNYFDIKEFISKTESRCRLPTEAEWEYAARAGSETRYYWGNLMDDRFAWFEDNAERKTHPVGQKTPNRYGLYDMSGNVWEWVEDWYTPYYSAWNRDNPAGPEKGENKVIRGGSFNSSAGALRSSNRTWLNPKNRVYTKITLFGGVVNEVYNYIGFRCARSIEAEGAAGSSADSSSKPAAG